MRVGFAQRSGHRYVGANLAQNKGDKVAVSRRKEKRQRVSKGGRTGIECVA